MMSLKTRSTVGYGGPILVLEIYHPFSYILHLKAEM